MIGWGSNLSAPTATINERPASPEEARVLTWLMLGIGVLVATGALAMIGCVSNTQIEVENGEIRSYDLLGRVRVRGSLASATIRGSGRESWLKVETDGGTIDLSSAISNYGELKTTIEDKAVPREWKSFPISSYIPTAQTFMARWGNMHLLSFVWLVGCGWFIRETFEEWPFLLGGLLLALPGVWMQLVGWFERIQIGPEGIEFIDFLGRSRVRARLDEIVGGDLDGGSESLSATIHTLRGTVTAGQNYVGQENLIYEVEKVIAGRERVA